MAQKDRTLENAAIRVGDVWDDEAMDMRLSGKRYRVYVNSDYVGDKMCTNDQDAKAVGDFLQTLGFSNYTISYDGNDIKIKAEDKDLAEKLRNHLQEYLDLR